jgi:hypothetical protein
MTFFCSALAHVFGGDGYVRHAGGGTG